MSSRPNRLLRVLLVVALLGAASCTDFDHECTSDEVCSHFFTDKYVCVENHCRRKFLEFSGLEITGLVVISLLVAMTNSGGVGAGTVISPTLVILFHFPIIFAIPQARVTILTGSLITFFMTGFSRKTNNPNRFQTDYSLAGVITPLILGGSQIGVILSRWLPALVISVLLILYISISLSQTYRRAKKESKRETIREETHRESLVGPFFVRQPKNRKANTNLSISDVSTVNNKDFDSNRVTDNLVEDGNSNDSSGEVRPMCSMIFEQLHNFCFILLSITAFIGSSLMRGGRTVDSIIGIEECSPMSWVVLGCGQLFCLLLASISYLFNKRSFRESDADLESTKGTEEGEIPPQEARIKLIIASYLAGLISGFMGVGGGMILGLYMLNIGLDVHSSTALSNFIVLVSSASTSFQFVAIGAIQVDNSLIFMGVALFGSAMGNLVFKQILRKLQKPSLIVWLLFSVLWLALAALSFEAGTNIMRKGKKALAFGRFC
jgi:uncharacterized membrane protein YfcA